MLSVSLILFQSQDKQIKHYNFHSYGIWINCDWTLVQSQLIHIPLTDEHGSPLTRLERLESFEECC